MTGAAGDPPEFQPHLYSREEKKTLDKEKEKTQKTLDAKYATMEERFLAYDKIISKLNSEFSSLKSMIEAEYNKK